MVPYGQQPVNEVIKRHLVTAIPYIFEGFIDPRVVPDITNVDVVIDYATRNIRYHVGLFLSSTEDKITTEEKAKVTSTVKYPLDWIQSLKERFLPKWILKKYPVKYFSAAVYTQRTVITKIVKMCPHLPFDPQKDHERWIVEYPPIPYGRFNNVHRN